MVSHRPSPAPPIVGGDILTDEEKEVEAEKDLRRRTNAITHFRVLNKRNDAALVECSAVTGIYTTPCSWLDAHHSL